VFRSVFYAAVVMSADECQVWLVNTQERECVVIG